MIDEGSIKLDRVRLACASKIRDDDDQSLPTPFYHFVEIIMSKSKSKIGKFCRRG